MFQLSIPGLVLRWYLTVLVVIVGFFTHQIWLVALALPLSISAILGIRLHRPAEGRESRVVPFEERETREIRKAG